MRTIKKSQYRYSKSQRIGIFALMGLIVSSMYIGNSLLNKKSLPAANEFPVELLQFQDNYDRIYDSGNKSITVFAEFNPNELDSKEWQALGFSEKQANTIIKYKYSLGGNFSNKEQLKECFVISEKKYLEIEPYIVIEEVKGFNDSDFNKNKAIAKINYRQFNPNRYEVKDWMKIGFSERQAKTILKYKRSLGGEFISKAQLKGCFVIDDKKFREMEPYIYIPDKKKEKVESGFVKILDDEFIPEETSVTDEPSVLITVLPDSLNHGISKTESGSFRVLD